MASRPNPTTMRHRSGRLSVFAQGKSDARASYNAPAPKHEVQQKRYDKPHPTAAADIPVPSREVIAEDARVSIPRVWGRQPLPHSPQKTLPQPPPKVESQPPRNNKREPSVELGESVRAEEKTHRPLFEGSQLGDDFMNSGLTTPQNEVEDVYLDHFEEERPERRKDDGNVRNSQLQPFNQGPDHMPQFQWTEDGYMVVKSGPGRQSPSHLRDGFQHGAIKERKNRYQKDDYRLSSPVDEAKNLPVREVKIRKPHPFARDNQTAKERPRSPSASSARQGWQHEYKEKTQGTSMVIDLSDDNASQADQDALHETPKAKKVNSAPQKTLMESSIPPVMSLNRHVHTKKRGRASPDYDDMALSAMTYTDLEREPFDLDPAQAAMQNSHGGDADPLTKKLDQVSRQSDREQRSFFSNLTMEDWEQSGDWFVDRFSVLMNQLRDARRNKRRMIHEFEAEASKHEEAVRLRSDAIDQKLVKMRQDGQRVVGDDGI